MENIPFKKQLNTYRYKRKIGALILGASAVLSFINTDRTAGIIYWPTNETSVNLLGYEENNKNRLWLIVPGLGVQDGRSIAESLDPTLGLNGQVAYVSYSNEEMDISKIASEFYAIYQSGEFNKVSIYGHSMGGPVALRIAEILQSYNNQLQIESFVFDSFPNDIEDAKNSAAKLASQVVKLYDGGPATKFGVVAFNEDPNRGFIENITEWWRITMTGTSPRLFSDQLKFLGDFNGTSSANIENYFYIRPQNLNNDEVVDNTAALNKYRQNIGKNVTQIIIYNGGHANPTERQSEYNKALSVALGNLASTRDIS